MATPAPRASRDLLLAYRHIYKSLLRAVQYSKPARFVARDRMRNAFRRGSMDEYDAVRVSRTLELLDNAAKTRGLEHKIVKNLMHTWWEQGKLGNSSKVRPNDLPLVKTAYDDFDCTIKALNESMGLCIK